MEDGDGSASARSTSVSNGLKQAVLSPNETLAQSIALIAPTAAPLLAVPLVFASAGQGCWLAFAVSTLTMVLVSLNINQFARLSASPGSLYSYVAEHMHPVLGMVAGWALLIAYIGTATAICGGFTNYVNVIVQDLTGVQIAPVLLGAVGVGLAAWLAYCDVQVSARLMLGLEAVSVGLIGIVAASLLLETGFHPDLSQLTLKGVTVDHLRVGLVLAIFSLVGFESATSLGSEARDPLRSIPRAVTWSAILAGTFFVVCAYAEVLGFRGEATGLERSVAPLQVLARKAGLPSAVGVLIDCGAVVSLFSCMLACLTAAARVLFLMGRHGRLPGPLGKAHQFRQTPHRAVLVSALATFLPLAALLLEGSDGSEVYGLMGTLATFGFLSTYILISLGAPLYLRALRRLTTWDLAVSILAVTAMGVTLLGSVYPVPAPPYSRLPYIYLVILLAGLTWSWMRTGQATFPANNEEQTVQALID